MRVDTRLLSSGLLLLLASVVERAALPGVSKGNYSSPGCCSFVEAGDYPLRQSKVHRKLCLFRMDLACHLSSFTCKPALNSLPITKSNCNDEQMATPGRERMHHGVDAAAQAEGDTPERGSTAG